MLVKIKKLHPDAVIPKYAHGANEDAGMDLVATENVYLPPFTPQAVPTGLSIELPPGYEAQIRSRSGLAFKHNVVVANAPGTIDPGYRGEIKVILVNNTYENIYRVNKGDKIAQMVIAKYEIADWVETELSESERSSNGFGSTGK